MSITWNYQQIQTFTRQISGQLDPNLLTNSQLAFFINNAYQYKLPREIKIEELYTQYTFSTIPNQADYILPGDFTDQFAQAFTHVEPRIYINGQPIYYTQNTDVFYKRIPFNFATELIANGNGATTNFPYTVQQPPIVSGQISSVMITDGTQVIYDNGSGTLLDSSNISRGTVVYTTGVINPTFAVAPALNTNVNVTYHLTQVARPNTCLFYQRTFTFYPCPDTTYQARIDAYFQPPQLVNPTDQPLKPEWGEYIACIAAKDILRNFGQWERRAELNEYWMEERSKVMSDTDNQLMATRTPQSF